MKIGSTRWNATLHSAILALAIVGLIAIVSAGVVELKDIATGLLALVGTFAGALLAFRLQGYGEELKETARRKAALNRAILVLAAQHNEVRTSLQELSAYTTKLDRAFNMPASQPPESIDLRQQLDDLSFLIETGHPQLIFDLFIEQIRFDQAMQMIRTRNTFYVNEVQPKLAEVLPNGTRATEEEIRELLGERLFVGAVTGGEQVHFHLDGSNTSILEAMSKTRLVSKEIFPNVKFLTFEPVPLPFESSQSV